VSSFLTALQHKAYNAVLRTDFNV